MAESSGLASTKSCMLIGCSLTRVDAIIVLQFLASVMRRGRDTGALAPALPRLSGVHAAWAVQRRVGAYQAIQQTLRGQAATPG